VVFITRSALVGLLVGAMCGALLVSNGAPLAAVKQLALQQFWPIFGSSWKLSAILFTLILGGFVALVEAGGGLQGLVHRLLGSGRAPHKRMQFTVFGFGLLVFFEHHADWPTIALGGRSLRRFAAEAGLSRGYDGLCGGVLGVYIHVDRLSAIDDPRRLCLGRP
jgi:Na+/H+ antiporter NhaC